jgi:hypothetical protein
MVASQVAAPYRSEASIRRPDSAVLIIVGRAFRCLQGVTSKTINIDNCLGERLRRFVRWVVSAQPEWLGTPCGRNSLTQHGQCCLALHGRPEYASPSTGAWRRPYRNGTPIVVETSISVEV